VLLDVVIDKEVALYVDLCQKASQHDEQEQLWKHLAHVTFYRIQELKTTKVLQSPIS
jgi:hypothetical protein